MHLTNVAIQKHGDEYNEKHGNKWTVKNLSERSLLRSGHHQSLICPLHAELYLEATRGHEATQRMFDSIHFIMVHSLKAVQVCESQPSACIGCRRWA